MRRYLFDLDGTIIKKFMDLPDRDFTAVELLPGVLETWRCLRYETGNNLGIISNQGGVAFGYQTEADVIRKFARVARALGYGHIEVHYGAGEPLETFSEGRGGEGVLAFWVCYADARSPDPRYNDPAQVARRKPSGAMIREAIAWDNDGDPLFVGDRSEDEAAARNAGVPFRWAEEFFR